MILKTIKYEKKIPVDRFGNETYGIEYTFEESEKISEFEVFAKAKLQVEKAFRLKIEQIKERELYADQKWEMPSWYSN